MEPVSNCPRCGASLSPDGGPCQHCSETGSGLPLQVVWAGKYLIEEQLGHGGMGTVYRAVDQSPRRAGALKVLHAGLADDPSLVARFDKEARIMARLDHPNLVPVYAVDVHE